MRYSDGPEVTVETTIVAPADVVWELVTDIELPARFSSEFQGATWDEGMDGPALGARFTGRNHNDGMGHWQVPCTVVAFDPPASFGWAVGDPDIPVATWRFDLVPRGDRTLLRQWARMGPGRSGMTPLIEAHPDKEERLVAARLEDWRANMQATVDGIKALAEGGAGG